MTATTDLQRTDRAALEAEVLAAGGEKRGNTYRCPFHEDKHPSGSIYSDDKGVVRFKCHGCGFSGDLYDVKAQTSGKPLTDVLREADTPAHAAKPTPPADPPRVYTIAEFEAILGDKHVATYSYTNPDTRKPELIVFRTADKQFPQARPAPGGSGIILGAPSGLKPIYNRTRLRAADAVVVVEGEKVVHALADIGVVATTSPMGAGNARHADWSVMAGKTAYLWHDNDLPDKNGKRPGLAHMQDVAAILATLRPPCRVFWIDADAMGLPPGGDAVEYLESLGDVDAEEARGCIHRVMAQAEAAADPAAGVTRIIADTISGIRRNIPWPWPKIGRLTKALLPGTVTVLCGDPGATKSFMLLQAMLHWHGAGHSISLFELEGGRSYHLYRALAQLEGKADLFDDEWVAEHPDEARAANQEHAEALRSFGARVWDSPAEPISLDALADWVGAQIADGVELIGVDPVTAAAAAEKPWIDDQRFLLRVKQMLTGSRSRLILVTHPKKGRKTAVGLDELAGGAAYARFPETVLWVEVHDPPKAMSVQTAFGPDDRLVNRSVRICKSRNGSGAGLRLAYHFEGRSLRLEELGLASSGRPGVNSDE